VADELSRLAVLFQEGALTPDEFRVAKEQVLGTSRPPPPLPREQTPPQPEADATWGDPEATLGGVPGHIGPYKVLEELGSGGMATVYRARHTSKTMARRQGGDVALKVLHPHLAAKSSYRKRFEREGEICSRLNHPNVVAVHDVLLFEGGCALVLQLVQGVPLSKVLRQRGAMPLDEALAWFEQLLDALAAAHAEGVVHRDLKPDNVLVRASDNTLHVVDFGIAAARQLTRNTRAGAQMGTYGYGAPEQFEDARKASARSDLYALGVILHEMVVGEPPWPMASDVRVILSAQLSGPPPTVGLPPQVSEAVRAMLQPNPANRPPSADAVRVLLRTSNDAGIRAKYYERAVWELGDHDAETEAWAEQLAGGRLSGTLEVPTLAPALPERRTVDDDEPEAPPEDHTFDRVLALAAVAVALFVWWLTV
jgi:serine/threonine protein kinase